MSSSNPAGAPVTSALGSLVAENELVHFLKLARPEWSKPRRRGRSDIVRVLAKLKAVGVNDIDTLIRKVEKNTINEELYNKGLMPLSRAALDSIRKQKTFMQALESVDVPNIRQVGVFDPVAQMLSRKPLPSASSTLRGRSSPSKRSEEGRKALRQGLPANTIGGMTAPQAGDDISPFIPDLLPPGKPCLFPRLRGCAARPRRLSPMQDPASADGFAGLSLAEGRSRSFSMTDAALGPGSFSSPQSKVTWSVTLPAGQLDTDDADGGETWRGISKRASTTPLFTDTGISARVSMLSRSPDNHHRSIPTPRTEEMLALQRAGQRILQTLEDRKGSAAKWSPKSWKTPLEQGEDMLQEQLALDERERIVRLVKSKSNPSDPFRGHIAQNIKQRLEMANNDSTEGLAINQRCLNIRKQLAGMVNARKELASLRAKAHLLMEEPLLPRLILDSYGLYSELND
ncbi:unnamed protein product [Symbiodinium sp. CCMP2456]|nr:unnamed protein product [Symbiodinium sp. CCMP2456]